MIDFCTQCTKCAAVCPTQAIPSGERQSYPDSTLRWKINPERCYTYWTKIGTDCGRCMAVCPYAHADNALHNLIRFGVAHSANFRSAAVWLDDFFYGKKPPSHQPPRWLDHD
jgi:ferredoxin